MDINRNNLAFVPFSEEDYASGKLGILGPQIPCAQFPVLTCREKNMWVEGCYTKVIDELALAKEHSFEDARDHVVDFDRWCAAGHAEQGIARFWVDRPCQRVELKLVVGVFESSYLCYAVGPFLFLRATHYNLGSFSF